jgi:xanthine dehydrogenase accessory factor
MTSEDALALAARLSGEGRAHVLATVVRVERPASARVGDHAVVTPDGVLSGWIGGACSEPTVVREALRSLARGEPRLVRIGPASRGGGSAARLAGVVLAESSCASEGVVEVMIEPRVPAPLVGVVGDGPAAETLRGLVRRVGWRASGDVAGADAVVVATMGRQDEEVLASVLGGAEVPGYVGLVASRRRGEAVRSSLVAGGVPVEGLRCPAGLDLGPCTQPEIAVAILAELVEHFHAHPVSRGGAGAGSVVVSEAGDPVCGMTVALACAVAVLEYETVTYAFCSEHCRAAFAADPARYATEVPA